MDSPHLERAPNMPVLSTNLTNTFPYQPLEHGNATIRLIALDPAADFSSDIHCSIRHVSLKSKPEYESLSYAWGDVSVTETIYVQQYPFKVTANLVSALRHLRLKDVARTLWADAICINQSDPQERGSQVAFMGNIYSMASRDIFWLGVDSHGVAKNAFNYVTMIAGYMDKYEIEDSEKKKKELLLAAFATINKQLLAMLSKVFHHPSVWTRIWVVQEIAMAQLVVVQCGFSTLPLLALHKFFDFYSRTPEPRYEKERFSIVNACWAARMLGKDDYLSSFESTTIEKESILSLWENFYSLGATDPRDKLFALLGLSNDLIAITPDYTKPSENLFIDTVTAAISQTRNLDALCLGNRRPNERNPKLPTWVIDFGSSADYVYLRTHQNIELYMASGNTLTSNAHWTSPTVGNSRLALSGVCLDKVSKVYEPLQTFPGWKECETKVRELLNDAALFKYELHGDESAIKVILRTLLLDCGLHGGRLSGLEAKLWSKHFRRNIFLRNRMLSVFGPKSDPAIEWDILGALETNCLDHTFCVTSKGLLALIPDFAAVGDVICVLYGSKLPHILRPVHDEDDVYQVMGACFVHGFMDGKALEWRDQGKVNEQTFHLV